MQYLCCLKSRLLGRVCLIPMLLLTLLAVSCAEDDVDDFSAGPFLENNPLPEGKGSLRVLAIGNSYTIDGTAYIGDILKSLDVDKSSYSLYVLTKGSSSLQYWNQQLSENNVVTAHHIDGARFIDAEKANIQELLRYRWDVIVVQQFSRLYIDYGSYNPSLHRIISYIRALCPNPDVTIAWQMIHAYGSDYRYNEGVSGDERWRCIVSATQQMMRYDGIDVVIPTGTAIQIARHSELQTDYDLTRDQTHLCYGVGRYVAAATWVQTLFSPVYGIDVSYARAVHPLTDTEKHESYDGFLPSSSVPVTDENRDVCLDCAVKACCHPFSLTD